MPPPRFRLSEAQQRLHPASRVVEASAGAAELLQGALWRRRALFGSHPGVDRLDTERGGAMAGLTRGWQVTASPAGTGLYCEPCVE